MRMLLAWNITFGKPKVVPALTQVRLRLSGDMCEPSGWQKTRASGSSLPTLARHRHVW